MKCVDFFVGQTNVTGLNSRNHDDSTCVQLLNVNMVLKGDMLP